MNKTLLHSNETYAKELAAFVDEVFPLWMKEGDEASAKGRASSRTFRARQKDEREFGRFYTDNFQLRALAGQSTDQKRARTLISPPDSANCTAYFIYSDLLFDSCNKGVPMPECPSGCDGPCFYETTAWETLTREDLEHAKRSLESFDAVLLTERLNDDVQSDFLTDLVGVPRDSKFAPKNKAEGKNSRVEKEDEREKTHFYRDLLKGLGLRKLLAMVRRENSLEIELFGYAEKPNEVQIGRWRAETTGLDILYDDSSRREEIESKIELLNAAEGTSVVQSSSDIAGETKTTAAAPSEDAHEYAVIVVVYHSKLFFSFVVCVA